MILATPENPHPEDLPDPNAAINPEPRPLNGAGIVENDRKQPFDDQLYSPFG